MLGWIYIGIAILIGVGGMVMMFVSQLVTRLPIPWPPEMPPDLVPFLGSMVVLAGVICFAMAAGVAAAGIGLLQYQNWGRILAVIMASSLIFWFPVGTAMAVYTFWVLFSEQGRNHYKARSSVRSA